MGDREGVGLLPELCAGKRRVKMDDGGGMCPVPMIYVGGREESRGTIEWMKEKRALNRRLNPV